MADRFQNLRADTQRRVLHGPGVVSAEVRQAIARGDGPEELRPLVAKVQATPWQVSDADLDGLRPRYDDDALFEVVVAAAVGAAEIRLQAALRALEEA